MKVKIEKSNVKEIFELNMVQKGMLYHYLKEGNENLYNVQLSFKIEGNFDIEVLKEAFKIVQSKNDVLRSVFRWEEVSKPIQIILKECPVAVFYNDLNESDEEADSFLRVLSEKDQKDRFDLTELPIKLRIIKLSDRKFIFNLTNHHILYDGWSNGILLKELFYSYNEIINGRNPILAEKPDFKTVLLSIQKNNNTSSKNIFWKNYLNDYQVSPLLSYEPSSESTSQEVKKIQIKTSISTLDKFAREHKVTQAAVLYAAYGLLLQIYNSSKDVVFGSTVSNRSSVISGSDQIIGNFISTVPLRVSSEQEVSILDQVKDVNNSLIERVAFHNYSLYEINQALELQTGTSLFDSVLSIENYPLSEEITNSIDGLNINLNTVYENTNVSLVVLAFFKETLELEFNYKKGALAEKYINDFAAHFVSVIEQVLNSPDEKIGNISLLSKKDEEKILYGFNKTQMEFPKNKSVIDLFEGQVLLNPDKIAVVYGDNKLTYSQLNDKANQLAHILIDKGVVKNDVISLAVDATENLAVGIIGVLKSGAAFLPINPQHPVGRIESISSDAKSRIIIASKKLLDKIEDGYIKLDIENLEPLENSLVNPSIKILPIDLLYVIYTSGTTGKPKGVMINNLNLLNYSFWLRDFIGLESSDKTVLATSFAFDLGYTAVFPSLLFGCELHLLPESIYKSPENFLNYIYDNKITYLKLTPSLFSTIAEHPDLKKLSYVKNLILGGEKIRPDDVEKAFEILPNIKIINHYGPTETTIGAISRYIPRELLNSYKILPTIGKPINNTKCYILNSDKKLVPITAVGELYIGGEGVGMGYLGRKDLTKEKFIPNPFNPKEIVYKTGDLARWDQDGNIQFLGRTDHQIKIRGYRIEMEEVEKQIRTHPLVKDVIVDIRESGGDHIMICYYLSEEIFNGSLLKDFLVNILPEYMIPSYFIQIDSVPLTINGKLDRKSLPDPEVNKTSNFLNASNYTEEILVEIWKDVLGHENVGVDRNFFELGGDSLKLIKASSRIMQRLKCKIQITDLFEYPTIKELGQFLVSGDKKEQIADSPLAEAETPASKGIIESVDVSDSDIAIIGMAGRFPDAKNVNDFWNNLKSGVDSITRNIEDADNPIIKAKGILEGSEFFEASFFNYTPDEAKIMDPQMRVFHECSWEALEDAGYNPLNYEGTIGLYGGASQNPFYNPVVIGNNVDDWMNQWQEYVYSTKDFLCPRVSYKLNLKGPSVNISTACSTSLVALDVACNDLLNNKCDIAIAGGVSLTFHDIDGYKYKKDMILSPDGYCRAFDRNAAGTVGGNGTGLIVIKKLKDALKDGDNIHAVIKGTATNNDGILKVGFTAPSVEGQAKVIKQAIKNSNVDPESISYIEAHGTGTVIGDPIELKGLTLAFNTGQKKICAIGSVKTNIGHLNAASGIAGLIKTVLALKNKQIPPSLNFREANTDIDFEESPFYVNNKLADWESTKFPRRAGVSSFGIGGTNAHVILQEAPQIDEPSESRNCQLIVLSAKTELALERNIKNLLAYLEEDETVNMADVAYTLNIGRASFEYKKAFIFENRIEAIKMLSYQNEYRNRDKINARNNGLVVFMFPGQGSQYINMCRGLYESEATFKSSLDKCFEIINESGGENLRTIVFPDNGSESKKINETQFTQPIIFAIEYALAKLIMSWGIKPDILIGHSLGEYTAACISGIFSLEDTLKLIVKRAELMQKLPQGSMLSINISEEKLRPYLLQRENISLASVNSSESCVVSGEDEAISAFKATIENDGFDSKMIRCSHAFHSYMMDAMMAEFEETLHKVIFNSPSIPITSTLYGKEIEDSLFLKPEYWVSQLRNTVRFYEAVSNNMTKDDTILIEVGPGSVLSSFVRSAKIRKKGQSIISLNKLGLDGGNDLRNILSGLRDLCLCGVSPDWSSFYKDEKRKRISLPTYSFEKIRYDFNKRTFFKKDVPNEDGLVRDQEVSKWFYMPSWKIQPLLRNKSFNDNFSSNLIFEDECGVGKFLVDKFRKEGRTVISVKRGKIFTEKNSNAYEINPGLEEDFVKLFKSLSQHKILPERIIHAWSIDKKVEGGFTEKDFLDSCNIYVYSLWNIIKASDSSGGVPFKQIALLTNNIFNVMGDELPVLAKSPTLGLLKVISQEYPTISTNHIDISLSAKYPDLGLVHENILSNRTGETIALRNDKRWLQIYDKIEKFEIGDSKIRNGGSYLITGGLGKLGFALSKYLLKSFNADLILIGRTQLPPEEDWDEYLLVSNKAEIKDKIIRIRELKKISTRVSYLSADVSDDFSLKGNGGNLKTRFAKLNGVIHAAGIISGKSKNHLIELEKEDFEHQFLSKVIGLHKLSDVVNLKELDFFLMASSLSTILGGLGFGAYASANTYLDHFVNLQTNCSETKWLSVNFDGLNLEDGTGKGINSQEINEVFDVIFSMYSLPQIVISVADLSKRIENWVLKEAIQQTQINGSDEGKLVDEKHANPSFTLTQVKLIKLWQLFFGNSEIDLDTDFFERGGDSLKALTMIGRIHKELNVELSVAELFAKPSIRELSIHIDAIMSININKTLKKNENYIPLAKAEEAEFYSLSSIQRRLYFLYEYDRLSVAYNMPQTLKLTGSINKVKILNAFKELISRHESLRTAFVFTEGEPKQKILEEFSFELEQFDGNNNEAQIICDFIKPFDLSMAPLVRAAIIDVSSEEHLLVVDMHHIITDGISKNILIKEFTSLYNNETLPPAKLQYKDYSDWKKENRKQQEMSNQRNFWLNEFKEESIVIDLPIDFTRPQTKDYGGNSLKFSLSLENSQKLKKLAENEGVTLFMIMLASYSILLSKLSNREDIVVGIPVSGREHPDLNDIIGMFVNTLPVRSFPNGDLTFKEFLAQIKSKTLSCFDNQSYPFEELIDELKVARSTSHNPLFDTVFSFENFQEGKMKIPGLEVSRLNDRQQIAKFDLTLSAYEHQDQIFLNFEYATSLFKEDTIELFVTYFKNIINYVTTDTDIYLSGIDIMSDRERNQLLNEFNNSNIKYPEHETIVSLFSKQVDLFPDKVAVKFENQEITYAELDKLSTRLGHALKNNGIETEHIVAILMDRSIDIIISILGVLKAGAAYLPIDVDYPDTRKEYMINDSGASILLTSINLTSEIKYKVRALNIEDANIHSGLCTKIESLINPSNLCYIIYTSGTTGNPKGVMVEHRNVVRLFFNQKFQFDFDSTDVWTMFHSPCFDFSVWEMYGALLFGGKVVVIPKMTARDTRAYLNVLKLEGVTILNQTPSAFYNLIQEEISNPTSDLNLRYIIFGGEALTPRKLKLWRDKYPEVRLVNMFGITETTVHVTYKEIGDFEIENNISNIGKPIPTLSVYIFDKYKKLVPKGTVGELYVGGAGVARGYLGKVELTNQKFILNPYNNRERLYRTGDLGRFLQDNDIQYIGRIDHQIQLRGFRIELGEIENHLLTHEEILETVVVDKERNGDRFLTAYYTAQYPVRTEDLRNFLSEKIPDYMIPSYFVHLKSFPLTINGKLDRDALPKPKIAVNEDYLAPSNETEKLLVEIWSDVLAIEKVGVLDNFFSIGGDSIKSLQIISKLRSAGYELSVKDIFKHQTISDLVQKLRLSESFDQSVVVGTGAITPIQQWFFLGPIANKNHFNQSVMLRFKDGISEQTVRIIFEKLMSHHDALRMVFGNENGKVFQTNLDDNLPLSLICYNLDSANDYELEILAGAKKLQSGLDIENGPLIKLGLFHLNNNESCLLIVIHHLVIDGVSWRILFEDIESLYKKIKENSPLNLPSKTDSYVSWSRKLLSYADTISDYQNLYKNIVPDKGSIPRTYENGTNFYKDRYYEPCELTEAETTKLLRKIHTAFNTKVNDILITALLMTIKKCYGHDEITIDLEGHGREHIIPGIDVSRTVGWFTTIYPVHFNFLGDNLSDLIKHTKEILRANSDNGVNYLLKNKGLRSGSQVCFNYLGQFDNDIQHNSYSISNLPKGNDISMEEKMEYDWDISCKIMDGRLLMLLGYSKNQFEKEQISSFVTLYKENLLLLINHCYIQNKIELTPSDLNYKKLTVSELNELQVKYQIKNIYPLTPTQEVMLFHASLNPKAEHFFVQIACQINGKLNVNAVEESMDILMNRYDILRTIFLDKNFERPLQVVLKNRKVDFFYKDIKQEMSDFPREEVILKYQNLDKSKLFDLGKDVLLRLSVYETGDNEFEFIWSHHHILMDGWCISIIINEFKSIYLALIRGNDLLLPPVNPYSRYIEWLEEKEDQGSIDYWRNYLKSYHTISSLPRKETAFLESTSTIRKTKEFWLDNKITNLLNSCSAKNSSTLNTLFQCAWGILLSKYNNINDVVFGSVVSGRPVEIEGIESMIGLFINTIPIRIKFSRNTTIEELLSEIQSEALENEFHNYHPLAEIQSLSELGSKLIDHIMIFENYPISDKIKIDEKIGKNSDDFSVSNVRSFDQSNYDFTILIFPGNEIRIKIDYNPDIYSDEIIERISAHFLLLISQIISSQNKPVAEISILSESEKQQLLFRFNNSNALIDRDRTFFEIFEEQVAKTPDQKAVQHGNSILTYQELYEKSLNLSSYLSNRGAKGMRVAFYLPRGIDLLVSILAVFRSGGIYVPLDVFYPITRIKQIIEDSGSELLLVNKELEINISDISDSFSGIREIVLVDCIEGENFDHNHLVSPGINDLSYIIYTSGTTGAPKGVMIHHLGMINHLFAKINDLGLNSKDIIAQTASPCFDISIWQFLSGLMVGGLTYIIDKEIILVPELLYEELQKGGVTIFESVPSLITNFLEGLPADSRKPLQFLRWMIPTGESLDVTLVKNWYLNFPEIKLLNAYGPTEASDDVTHYIVEYPKDGQQNIPIGRPIQNTKIYIVDHNMNLCPIGIRGEICVSGLCVGKGYWNDEERTNKVFIQNPFVNGENDEDYYTLYRTGDIGFYSENGEIICLGRVDEQIKIRGNRIEPGEIENVMILYPSITEVKIINKVINGNKVLIAYYTSSSTINEKDLRDYLSEKLPDYMMPSYFIELNKFELTENGKLNKKALPDPDFTRGDDHVLASNETEEKLLVVWAEVLRIDKETISVNDNFFELGGHSLKATVLVNKINKLLNIAIPLKEIFAKPTLKQQADFIQINHWLSMDSEDLGSLTKTEITL